MSQHRFTRSLRAGLAGLVCGFAVALASPGTARAQVSYTVTELGIAPHLMVGFPRYGYGLNAHGDVVSSAFRATTQTFEAVLYSDGSLQNLGTLGGTRAEAIAINRQGDIAGRYSFPVGSFFATRGFILSAGTITSIPGDPVGYAEAYAINDRGEIAGIGGFVSNNTTPSFQRHAFRYGNGVMQDLGTLGGQTSEAFDINNAGQVVGDAETAIPRGSSRVGRAFRDSGSGMQDLGTLGGTSSGAIAINDAGDVVGGAELADGRFHAFLYRNGAMLDIDTFGSIASRAQDINASGQVVGTRSVQAFTSPRAFFYDGIEMRDLNDLLDPALGWHLEEAGAINDAGQIVAMGYRIRNGSFDYQVVLLNPVPEPESFLLMLAGLGLIGFAARRKARA